MSASGAERPLPCVRSKKKFAVINANGRPVAASELPA